MNWLLNILSVVSILLITLILLQKTNTDGTGALSSDGFIGKTQKRGLEKMVFNITILMGIVFAVLNVVAIFVK